DSENLCVRAESGGRRQPVRAYGLEDPGWICQRLHYRNRADTRRVPLAGNSLWLVSLRWGSKRTLAATPRSATPFQHHHKNGRGACRNPLDRYMEWTRKL